MSVGSCNATGAPRGRTKNPPPASEAAMPVQSNSSAITKKNVSTEFKEKDIWTCKHDSLFIPIFALGRL